MSKRPFIKALLWFVLTTLSAQSLGQQNVEFEKGIVAVNNGEIQEAIIHFKNALQEMPTHLPARSRLGGLYLQLNQLELAKEHLELALQQGADKNVIVPQLMEILSKQGNDSEAGDLLTNYPKVTAQWLSQYWYSRLLSGQFRQSEAIEILEKLIQQSHSDPRIFFERGKIAAEQGQWDRVRDMTAVLSELSDGELYLFILQGIEASKQELHEKANLFLRQALVIAPDNTIALFLQAFTLYQIGKYEQAIALVMRLREQQPSDPMASLLHALILSSQGTNDDSKQMLEDIENQLSKIDTSNESGYRGYLASALLHKLQGRYDEALSNTRRYLSYVKNDATAKKLHAELLLLSGKPSEARLYLIELIEDGIAGPEDYLNLASVYKQLNQPRQFQQIIEQGIQRFPSSQGLILRQALLYVEQGQRDAAMSLLEKQDQEPSNIQSALVITRLYLTLEHPDTPQKISQLLADNPTMVGAHQLAGEYSLKRRKPEEAKRFFEQALALSNNTAPEPMFFLASLAIKSGETELAEQWLERLETLAPDNIAIMGLLADFYIKNKKLERALPYLRERYERNRSVSDAMALVDIYLKLSQVEEARSVLQQALRFHRLHPQVLEYQWYFASLDGDEVLAMRNLRLLADIHFDTASKLSEVVNKQISSMNKENETEQEQEVEGNLHRLSQLSFDKDRIALLHAKLLIKKGEKDAAIQALAGVNGHDADFLRYGLSISSGELEESRTIIARLYEKEPQIYRQHYIAFLMETGDISRLISVLEAYLSHDVSDTSAVLLYAALLSRNDELDKVEKFLLDALKVNQSELLQNQLANVYLKRTNINSAYEHAKIAYDMAPANAAINDTLGWVLFKKGQTKAALPLLRAAYSKASLQPDVNYHLAEALLKLDRREEARVLFEAAIKLGGEGGKSASQRLSQLNLAGEDTQ